MSAPAKQSSRWGSFLQQAVAGVESRLDNILAEGEEAPKPAKSPAPASTATLAPNAKSENGVSRSSSTRSSSSRGNDRLQERLARAMAAKNARSDSSPRQSKDLSRSGSPAQAVDSPRSSIDVQSVGEETPAVEAESKADRNEDGKDAKAIEQIVDDEKLSAEDTETKTEDSTTLTKEAETTSRPSIEVTVPPPADSNIQPTENTNALTETPHEAGALPSSTDGDVDYKALLEELQSNYAKSEIQRQEEIHGYIERIDALQSKLQYLARETAESARNATNSATTSADKKLAAKDEQIALLMEEGQKLSKTELKHMTLIKKLRAKIAEDDKETAELKKKAEQFDNEKAALLERIRRAELFEKQSNEKSKTIQQLHRDLDATKSDRDAKNATIAQLKTELKEQASQAKEAEVKAIQELLDTEKKKNLKLEEELATLRAEKEAAAEQSRIEIKELKDKLERAAERSKAVEIEMRTEQQMLESKLEVMRARAEEVSSGATGDAQAKLLRQIETLQTQYSVASENWQGIEASLASRATRLEKERDEATKREADVRKKARELALKSKRLESDLEDSRSYHEGLQKEVSEYKEQVEKLKKRLDDIEAAATEAKKAFEEEKEAWSSSFQSRLEEERSKSREDLASSPFARAESPSIHRGSSTDFLALQGFARKASARSITSDLPFRTPASGPRSPELSPPYRQDSMQSLGASMEMPQTPAFSNIDQDDLFNERFESSKPQTINDMISVSTVGAGPSVQLVERMSAAVRRLENEKVATKEELARLTTQRNDAKAEVLRLMQELEGKSSADSKIEKLESELAELNARYNTTLEMLGEKSELVEELKADVQDVKAMYRELVERTIK